MHIDGESAFPLPRVGLKEGLLGPTMPALLIRMSTAPTSVQGRADRYGIGDVDAAIGIGRDIDRDDLDAVRPQTFRRRRSSPLPPPVTIARLMSCSPAVR